jgi:formylglycine-generating enzyme required for sulfatase activity
VVGQVHGKRYGMHTGELMPGDEDGFSTVAPPGALIWGASPYGAYDMAGNVSEWVADYFSKDGYDDLPAIDPRRSIAPGHERRRAVRGGSWLELRLSTLSYDRQGADPELRSFTLGFRCARSVE